MDNGTSVLLVALSKNFGGADVRVHQTARALHAAGRSYAVAVIAGSGLHRKLAAEGLNTRPLAYRRSDPRLVVALRRLIVDDAFEVVDAHNPQSQVWGLLAARAAGRRQLVSTVHSVYRTAHGSLPRGLLHEMALRLNHRMGCRFIAVSPNVHDYLLQLGIADGRIMLSRNGVDCRTTAITPAGMRAALGWSEDAFVITAVGRVEQVKGHRFLLNALARLRAHHRSLRCLIVGTGRDEGALRVEAERLGLGEVVHFTGFRTDVANILAEADLFCMPSLMEGIPYAALEAAQMGLPVLASNVGGLAEVFTHNRDALLVPPGCDASLADALAWAAAHRQQGRALGRAARRTVLERFDVARMSTETLAFYDAAAPGAALPS